MGARNSSFLEIKTGLIAQEVLSQTMEIYITLEWQLLKSTFVAVSYNLILIISPADIVSQNFKPLDEVFMLIIDGNNQNFALRYDFVDLW